VRNVRDGWIVVIDFGGKESEYEKYQLDKDLFD
jgi:hypothetical protein